MPGGGAPRGAGTGFGLTRRTGLAGRGGENRFADFGTEIPAVSKRIRHVFQSGELEREATVSEMEMVRPMEVLQVLRDKFGGSEWFAHEKDGSFRSTMGAIYKTFGGRDLYPGVEEKAANLLCLTVKNHSFSDGNKRIAAFLFLWFLENNRILYRADGSRLLDNNTLVALTLMIAESRAEEKDVMTKVIVNLINKNN